MKGCHVRLDDALLKAAKVKAAQEGITLTALIAQLLTDWTAK